MAVDALVADIGPYRDLRTLLPKNFEDHVKHAHPPYGDHVPADLAVRIEKLFELFQGNGMDGDGNPVGPLASMSDDWLQHVALELSETYVDLKIALALHRSRIVVP